MHTTSPKWFTIMEILVTISILAIAFAWIFVVLKNSSWLIAQSQAKTQTINLSREGIEIVHNIRDTNWMRRSWQKEECRLKADPLADDDGICSNDDRIQAWRYTIIQQSTENNQQYFALQTVSGAGLDDAENARAISWDIQICDQWSIGENCDTSHGQTILRVIEIKGLYQKDTTTVWGEMLNCNNGEDPLCGTNSPKELVFCAHTHSIGEKITKTTLCSAITNFAQ